MSTTKEYELLYFPIPGRGEQIRLLFAYAGVPFTDTKIPPTEWPAWKAKMPQGMVPVLYERGQEGEIAIPQSVSIMRHLARTYNLYGKTERHHTLCDVIADSVAEWRYSWAPVAYPQFFNTTEDTIARYWKEAPVTFGRWERILGQSTAPSAGWFVEEKPTFADIMVFEILTQHLTARANCLADFPGLKGFVERVAALPGISEHVKKQSA